MKTFYYKLSAIVVIAIMVAGLTTCQKEIIAPPTVKLFGDGPNSISFTSASVSAEVADQGGAEVKSRGFAYGLSGGSMDTIFCGSGTGAFSAELTGLQPNTMYVYEAFARNAGGTGTSGKVTFTTRDNELPIVKTSEVENIGTTTASCGGNATGDGGANITERGVCWSTNHNPTVNESHVSSGSGLGEFACNLSNLSANTTYYVRAYAKNSKGIGYGEEKHFTTLDLPTVSTGSVTNITTTSAMGGGNVTNDGGSDVTERGLCWSTHHEPTINGTHVEAGDGMGEFTAAMTNLTANTTYYVRAYATNGVGTSYGDEVEFTTQSISVPGVTTTSVTNITNTSATGGGNVISTGGANVIERGICWSTSHSPTISGNHDNNGTGTGEFTVNMTGLTPNTTYYVRAYAINSQGPAYGEEVNFKTSQTPNYTISVSANPTSGGTVTGGGTYEQGQSCTVRATAATGYIFQKWTENGTQVSTNSSYTFNVNGNHTLVAQFQAQSYTISVSSSPSNGGTVSGGGTYTYGQSCTVHAAASNSYTFTNWTENGSQVSTNANYTFTVTSNRSLVAQFTYNPQAPTGAINGLFSVSATKQVWFSQGNLQYKASTNTWRFATNQYDYIGSANSNISSSYNGWIDLFGWGTSGWNCGNTYYRPWHSNNSDGSLYGPPGQYNLTGSYANSDWGRYNAISNGGNTSNTWRTLTQSEWDYVFNTRSTSSGIRYAKAVVNNVNGVILLPDNWNSSYYNLYRTNTSGASFNSNVISSSPWTNSLQSHGAVFLPAAGYRNGTSVQGNGSFGGYWSTSCRNDDKAFVIDFYDNSLYTDTAGKRCSGWSVRLVCPAQ